MRPLPPAYGDVLELHVSLRHVEPAIWRRVRLPADVTLGMLHDILQLVFGWKNSHLHDFHVGDVCFGMADVEDELFVVDEHAAPLGAVARAGSKFMYRYDYGDDWEHEVTVERMMDGGDDDTIVCVGGVRACPPEDCGGPPGYANVLAALANPKHPEHNDIKRWVGRGFDPERFDLASVNKKLAALSKRLGRQSQKRWSIIGAKKKTTSVRLALGSDGRAVRVPPNYARYSRS